MAEPYQRAVIVTGASGYIGSRLVDLARAQGRDVTLLNRAPGGLGVAWSLGEALPDAAVDPAGAQALIHLAHDWRSSGGNVEGTRRLLESARRLGIDRTVFVSSQSARADAANAYGRVKWQIERLLTPGEVAARVGLVYGGPMRAQYGLLGRLTRHAPVLPMIDPWREVQPIHLDEVCRGLLLLADGGQTGWVGLAGAPVRFDRVLKAFARELHGRRLPILPVPLRAALLACDVSAAVPFGPTLDRERVLGLAGTRPMECAEHLAALGLEVAPIEVGLRREKASRKAVLVEGRRLLRFVLGAPPGSALLRRYARALGGDGPLAGGSGLLRLGEPLRRESPLGRRLALACALAEASPEGEARLAAGTRWRLALHLAADVAALPIRMLFHGIRR